MARKIIFVAALFAALGGCASGLSEEECVAGRAADIGYTDGLEGSLLSRVSDRIEQCARFEVGFDDVSYTRGWRSGNAVFCTPEGALDVALRGRGDIRACPNADYLTGEAFRVGRAHHAAEEELDDARDDYRSLLSRIDSTRRNIDITARKLRDEPDANQRRELADRLARYRRDLREAYDRLDYARREIRFAENDYNRAEYDLVRLRSELRRRAFDRSAPPPEPVPAPRADDDEPPAPDYDTTEGEADFPDLIDG